MTCRQRGPLPGKYVGTRARGAADRAAAAGTGAGLEIVQEQPAPTRRRSLEQLFDSRQVRLEGLPITDGHPGERLGYFTQFRSRTAGKTLLPVVVGAEGRHPARMGRGQ